MRNILNCTPRPLRIPLPGGKTLHLAPAHVGQVSDDAIEDIVIAEMLDAGELELVDEAGHGHIPQNGPGHHGHGALHHPRSVVRPKGDR